jgi:hypothetical protein
MIDTLTCAGDLSEYWISVLRLKESNALGEKRRFATSTDSVAAVGSVHPAIAARSGKAIEQPAETGLITMAT